MKIYYVKILVRNGDYDQEVYGCVESESEPTIEEAFREVWCDEYPDIGARGYRWVDEENILVDVMVLNITEEVKNTLRDLDII